MNIFYDDHVLFADVVLTSGAQHEEELMNSDFVRLSWNDAEYYEIPVGAYVIPYDDNIRYELLEPYVPEQKSGCEWHYEPQFQHPKMYLGKVIFERPSKDTSGNDISYMEWPYTGSVTTILAEIVGNINKILGLSDGDELGFKLLDFEDKVISVQFSSNDILSAITSIANACECEAHIDWKLKMLYFGKVSYPALNGNIPVLTVGGNIQIPSTRDAKDGYFNAYYPQGSARNIMRKSQSEEFVLSDVRLSLRNMNVTEDKPKGDYPDGILYFDNEGNRIFKHCDREGEILPGFYDSPEADANPVGFNGKVFMKPLIFEDIYPKTDMYIYDVRYREMYRLDSDEDKEDRRIVTYVDDDGTKHYLRYAKWYVKLAAPRKVGGSIVWDDYQIKEVVRYQYNKNNVVCDDENYKIDIPLHIFDGALTNGTPYLFGYNKLPDTPEAERDEVWYNTSHEYDAVVKRISDEIKAKYKDFVVVSESDRAITTRPDYIPETTPRPWPRETDDNQTSFSSEGEYTLVYVQKTCKVAMFVDGSDVKGKPIEGYSYIPYRAIDIRTTLKDSFGRAVIRVHTNYGWREETPSYNTQYIFGDKVYNNGSFGREWTVTDIADALPHQTETQEFVYLNWFTKDIQKIYDITIEKNGVSALSTYHNDVISVSLDAETYADFKAEILQGGYIQITDGIDPKKVGEENRTSQIVDGFKPILAFQPNDFKEYVSGRYEYALPTPLAGLGKGDGNGHYGFTVRSLRMEGDEYIREANAEPTEEGDTGIRNISGNHDTVDADHFEIEFEEDGQTIIPSIIDQGITPRALVSGKSQRNNKVNVYNVVPDGGAEDMAKAELLDKTLEYISENDKDNDSRTFKSDPVLFESNNPNLFIGQKIILDDGIDIQDPHRDTGAHRKEMRVMKLTTNLDFDFEQEITVGNMIIKGNATQAKENVEAIIQGNLPVGSALSESYIKSLITAITTPSFLSKVTEDFATQTIGFLKGLWVNAKGLFGIDEDGNAKLNKVTSNEAEVSGDATVNGRLTAAQIVANVLQSPDFREAVGMIGKGFGLTIDENGKSKLQTDDFLVLGSMIVNNLNIREVSYIGGTYFLSPAASKAVEVMPLYANGDSSDTRQWFTKGTGDIVGYRLLWLADNGSTSTMNYWQQGDQAYCQTFNVTAPGQYHDVHNQRYWRLVCRVGQVEMDERMYHYADVANVLNVYLYDDEGNQILNEGGTALFKGFENGVKTEPAKDDTVICLGSQRDRSRQSAIQITAEGIGSIGIYDNINNYGLLSDYEIHYFGKDAVRMRADRFMWTTANNTSRPPVVYQGEWSEGSVSRWGYEWSYNGANYICVLAEGTTTEAPNTTPANWVASKGEKGESAPVYSFSVSLDNIRVNTYGNYIDKEGEEKDNVEFTVNAYKEVDSVRDVSFVAQASVYTYYSDNTINEEHKNVRASTTTFSKPYRKENGATITGISIRFRNTQTNFIYEYRTINVIKDGENGTSPYFADIDNEMDSMACDKDGKALAAYDKYVGVGIWCGSTEQDIATLTYRVNNSQEYSTEQTVGGITITPDKTNKRIRIRVAQNATLAEINDIRITIASADSGNRALHFTLNAIRAAADGKTPTLFSIVPSVNSIKRDKGGVLTPDTISCSVEKITGDNVATAVAGDGTLRYRLDGDITSSSDGEALTIGGSVTPLSSNKYVTFAFFVGTATRDKERVPIVYDGEDGKSITKKSADTYRYATNNTGVRPASDSQDWSTTKPTLQGGYWLYTETTIHWSDDSTTVIYSEERNPNDGVSGQDIIVDGATVMKYYVGDSNTTHPADSSSDWKDLSQVTQVQGKWLWSQATTYYRKADSTAGSHDAGSSINYNVSYISKDGINGRGIRSFTEYYQATNSSASRQKPTSASGWSTDPNLGDLTDKWDENHKYLWNMEETVYTNSDGSTTTEYSTPQILAIWTKDGDAGRGIDSIQNYYKITNSSTLPARTDSGWSTTPLVPTAENPYLYNYEAITWVNPASTTYTDVQMLGHFGKDASEVRPNLLRQTMFVSGKMDEWAVTDGNIIEEGLDGHNVYHNTVNHNLGQYVYGTGHEILMPATIYTISFWSKGYVFIDLNPNVGDEDAFFDASWGRIVDGVKYGAYSDFGYSFSDSDWTYHTYTFKTKSTFPQTEALLYWDAGSWLSETAEYWLSMPKLERGDSATAYLANDEELKGTDGTSPVIADIDDEMDSIACDYNGIPATGYSKTLHVKLFDGTNIVPLNQIIVSGEHTNITVTPDAQTGTIAISCGTANQIAANTRLTFTLKATGYEDHDVFFTLNGVRAGQNGQPAVLYKVSPSVTTVSKAYGGTPSVASVSCAKIKIDGSNRAVTTDGTLKYSVDGGTEQDYSTPVPSTFTRSLEFILYVNNEVVDRETIPMITDGQQGIQGIQGNAGADGIRIVTDPSNVIIEQNYDDVNSFGLPFYVSFEVYQGDNKLTVTNVTGTDGSATIKNTDLDVSKLNITTAQITTIRKVDNDYKRQYDFTARVVTTVGGVNKYYDVKVPVYVNLMGKFTTEIKGDVETSVARDIGAAIDPSGGVSTLAQVGTYIRSASENVSRIEKTVVANGNKNYFGFHRGIDFGDVIQAVQPYGVVVPYANFSYSGDFTTANGRREKTGDSTNNARFIDTITVVTNMPRQKVVLTINSSTETNYDFIYASFDTTNGLTKNGNVVTDGSTTISSYNGLDTTHKTHAATGIASKTIEYTFVNAGTYKIGILFFKDGSSHQNEDKVWYSIDTGRTSLSNIPIDGAGDYIVSFEAKRGSGSQAQTIQLGDGTAWNQDITTEWQTYKHVFTITNTAATTLAFIANAMLLLRHLKIERGQTATEFKVADEDNEYITSNRPYGSWEKTNLVADTMTCPSNKQVWKTSAMPAVRSTINYIYKNGMTLEAGKVYTLSFWCKSSNGNHLIQSFLYTPVISGETREYGIIDASVLFISESGSKQSERVEANGVTSIPVTTEWVKHYVHFFVAKVDANHPISCIPMRLSGGSSENNSGYVYISDVDFAEGYVITQNDAINSSYSEIKQTADEITLGVKKTGVDIKDGKIDLYADKVKFYKNKSAAQAGDEAKIWIDGDNGTLHAVDGDFEGTVRASNFFHRVCILSVGNGNNRLWYCKPNSDGYDTHDESFYYLYHNEDFFDNFEEGRYYTAEEINTLSGGQITNYSIGFEACVGYSDIVYVVPKVDAYGNESYPVVWLPKPEDVQGKIIDVYGTTHNQNYETVYVKIVGVWGGYDRFVVAPYYNDSGVLTSSRIEGGASFATNQPMRFMSINVNGKWYWFAQAFFEPI